MSILIHFFNVLYLTSSFFFFFNDTATTEIYTLSLHDALPISSATVAALQSTFGAPPVKRRKAVGISMVTRSEEHTSELQSLTNLVCRLLLEKKKKTSTDTRGCGRHPRTRPMCVLRVCLSTAVA